MGSAGHVALKTSIGYTGATNGDYTEAIDNRTPNEAEDAFNQQQNELAEAAQLLDKNSLEEPRQSKFKIKTALALCKESSNLSLSLVSGRVPRFFSSFGRLPAVRNRLVPVVSAASGPDQGLNRRRKVDRPAPGAVFRGFGAGSAVGRLAACGFW